MKLGIDVGGTQTKVAVLRDTCEVITGHSYPTVVGQQPFMDFLSGIILDNKRAWPAIESVGIGIPGKVDTDRGSIVFSPALQIENLDFCSRLRAACSLPVFAENDVNAWALAERAVGSCQGLDNYVLITIGTGIGAGIVIGGRIYRGYNFEAGEIGYMVSEEDYDTPCPTKADFGAFETRASAIAVSNRYNTLAKTSIDTREIFLRAHKHQDPIALELIRQQMKHLAIGISNIICILQPEKVVVGGGLAGEGDYLIDHLNQYVRRLIPTEVPIVLSGTGKWGGAIGAALSAASTRKTDNFD